MNTQHKLMPAQEATLLQLLKARYTLFRMGREWPAWSEVEALLCRRPDSMWSLFRMDETGGEPSLLEVDSTSGSLFFCDCSPESPKGRRSLCYDQAAWVTRKENKPAGSAMSMAQEMGIDLLNEEQYFVLQQRGEFDTKTSSWLLTVESVRNRGGAVFGDRRYDRVFVYHNGAESYYAARGFRGCLTVNLD